MTSVPNSLTVAVAQLPCTDGSVDLNLRRAEEAVKTAAARGADLVVLPEAQLTGFPPVSECAAAALDTASSPELLAMRELCAANHVAAVVGYAERASAGNRVYNTALFIDAGGNDLARYRKTHLFLGEDRLFYPGATLTKFDLDGVRVGLLICYDIEFPEPARLLGSHGVQLLCVSSANMRPYGPIHRTAIQARAFENHAFVAYANRLGEGRNNTLYVGESAVVDPFGRVLIDAEDCEGVFMATVELGEVQRSRAAYDYLRERRTGLRVVTGFEPASGSIEGAPREALAGASRPLRSAQVGVYAGPGTWQEGRHAIENMLDAHGITWETLYPGHINDNSFAGKVRAVWIPGGFAGAYNRDLSADGKEHIRRFVRGGGGFLGTCAGSYFGSAGSLWEGEYDEQPLWFFPGTARGVVEAVSPWHSWTLTPFELDMEQDVNKGLEPCFDGLYFGGPEFLEAGSMEGQGVRVVGSFARTHRAALVTVDVGAGRAVLMSPHLEIGYDAAARTWDFLGGHGANWEWLATAVCWVLEYGEAN